ncbi:MAG: chromosomal replication initiator protein DnaA [Clostridia bacterium]|nr:chromosomal replication initiator protein DnaA [Clostridia bacterium]
MEKQDDLIISQAPAPDVNAIWEEAKLSISKDITAVSFDVWIDSLIPVSIVDDSFVLCANSISGKNIILKNEKYYNSILNSIKEIYPQISKVEVVVRAQTARQEENSIVDRVAAPQPQVTIKPEPAKPAQSSFVFNPKYTFDNYVIGGNNQFVAAAAKAVAENPGISYNPLFIYGGVGLGKTHLLHAIGNYITQNHPELNVVYVTIEKFTNDLIASIQNGTSLAKSEFRTKYRSADVLIVDDIQFIINRNSVQEEFFNTFNELNQNGKQIVISSDKPPKEINPLEERLRSRFEWGLLADIGVPDIETRIAILNKKANLERYNVDSDVISYIAEAVKTNIREMEGLLNRAVFYAGLLGKTQVTMEIAREALKNYLTETQESVNADSIVEIVSKYYNIKKDELIARKRTKEIAEARQIAMFLISEFINIPLASIGAIFGKDHATVIYAKNKVAEDMKTNQKLAVQINDMKQMIKNK